MSKIDRITDDLRAAIRNGTHPPGATLPTQDELAVTHGVSIGTIRKAVNQLLAEGLVYTVRHVGTVVRDTNPVRLSITRYEHTSTTPTQGPWESACAEQGLVGVTDVIGVGWCPAPGDVAAALGVSEGEDVIRRDNRMRVGDLVLQLQTTWLPGSVADGTPLAGARKVEGGIYRGLGDAGFTVTDVVESVSGRMPTLDEARVFGLRLGSPVLDVRRTTRGRSVDAVGMPLVFTHVVVAADRVCLVYPQTL